MKRHAHFWLSVMLLTAGAVTSLRADTPAHQHEFMLGPDSVGRIVVSLQDFPETLYADTRMQYPQRVLREAFKVSGTRNEVSIGFSGLFPEPPENQVRPNDEPANFISQWELRIEGDTGPFASGSWTAPNAAYPRFDVRFASTHVSNGSNVIIKVRFKAVMWDAQGVRHESDWYDDSFRFIAHNNAVVWGTRTNGVGDPSPSWITATQDLRAGANQALATSHQLVPASDQDAQDMTVSEVLDVVKNGTVFLVTAHGSSAGIYESVVLQSGQTGCYWFFLTDQDDSIWVRARQKSQGPGGPLPVEDWIPPYSLIGMWSCSTLMHLTSPHNSWPGTWQQSDAYPENAFFIYGNLLKGFAGGNQAIIGYREVMYSHAATPAEMAEYLRLGRIRAPRCENSIGVYASRIMTLLSGGARLEDATTLVESAESPFGESLIGLRSYTEDIDGKQTKVFDYQPIERVGDGDLRLKYVYLTPIERQSRLGAQLSLNVLGTLIDRRKL